ncbi:MAG: formate hydrogenlyase [Cytophagales bacterium]|nr:MAG: formate hydrogenlyase [Cytophagales bacterium]
MIGLALILISAFFFPGVILQTKAKASGRYGAGILQPWKDIWRLARKGSVYSTTTTIIFQIAPSINLAAVICAMLMLPFANQPAILSFDGDVVMFCYVLSLGRFFMILAAMDTGSPFEGMGANREALFSVFAEPAFFILMGSLAMFTEHTSFDSIYQHLYFEDYFSSLIGILASYLLVQMAMVENSRLPVDDPTTHLELTMIHEVMTLDNSGIDMAMLQFASTLKFAIFGSLIANFFLQPHSVLVASPVALAMNSIVFLVIQFIFSVMVGLLESFRARFKMNKNPQFILTLSSVAVIIFFTVLIITQKI